MAQLLRYNTKAALDVSNRDAILDEFAPLGVSGILF